MTKRQIVVTALAAIAVLAPQTSAHTAGGNVEQPGWQVAQLGQSEWQSPNQSQSQSQQSPLGQSEWQLPNQSQSRPQQSPLGQSEWQSPNQSQSQSQQPQLGQSDWQLPSQAQSQSPKQQNYYQNNSYGGQYTTQQYQQSTPTYYGQANQSQYMQPGQSASSSFNQQVNSGQNLNTLISTSPNQTKTKKAHEHKDHDGLKEAVGTVGKAVAVGAGIAAPLAGAYLIGKSLNNAYSRMPYGYGYPAYGMGGLGGLGGYGYPMRTINPYYANPYGYGYGLGGMSSFMHF